MNNQIKIKKIWSLNPTKYKTITLKEASKNYSEYVNHMVKKHKGENIKSFIQWLETEI